MNKPITHDLLAEDTAVFLLTVFDLDRTITRHGTYSPFLLYAALSLAPWRLVLLPVVVLAMAAYRIGFIQRGTLKEIMQQLLLGRAINRLTVERLATGFAKRVLSSNINHDALEEIRAERAAGRTLIIATAAHRFYADAIAALLGIEHVVATESEWQADTLLPRIQGKNCHGLEKAAALTRWLEEKFNVPRSRLRLRFYSDDASDLSCFEMCDEAIAVNPSPKLRQLAHLRRWPILYFK